MFFGARQIFPANGLIKFFESDNFSISKQAYLGDRLEANIFLLLIFEFEFDYLGIGRMVFNGYLNFH